MNGRREPTFLYIDDGHPESRDYDDNYVVIEPNEPRTLLRRLLRLPAASPRKTAPLTLVRSETLPQRA